MIYIGNPKCGSVQGNYIATDRFFCYKQSAMKWMDKNKLVLASRSPRRKKLLEQMGLAIDIAPPDMDETGESGQSPGDFVTALSEKKARNIMHQHEDSWVIAAVTIVVKDSQILGKPINRENAIHMIGFLSGRTHSVFTGYTVGHGTRRQMETHAVETQVLFKTLTKEEIFWYTGTDEPYDKAGGYAVQGLGSFMVQKICGSYTNVVGLPVCEVIQTLQSLKAIQF